MASQGGGPVNPGSSIAARPPGSWRVSLRGASTLTFGKLCENGFNLPARTGFWTGASACPIFGHLTTRFRRLFSLGYALIS
jgi:hypothetical protein